MTNSNSINCRQDFPDFFGFGAALCLVSARESTVPTERSVYRVIVEGPYRASTGDGPATSHRRGVFQGIGQPIGQVILLSSDRTSVSISGLAATRYDLKVHASEIGNVRLRCGFCGESRRFDFACGAASAIASTYVTSVRTVKVAHSRANASQTECLQSGAVLLSAVPSRSGQIPEIVLI